MTVIEVSADIVRIKAKDVDVGCQRPCHLGTNLIHQRLELVMGCDGV